MERRIDWQALGLYLTFNYIPAPLSIFQNIRKLLPGQTLCFCGGNGQHRRILEHRSRRRLRTARSWGSTNRRRDSSRRWMKPSKSHMIADVPVGAFLSGGIDSSIIVGLMARHSSRPVQTYTIGFADMPLFDERS